MLTIWARAISDSLSIANIERRNRRSTAFLHNDITIWECATAMSVLADPMQVAQRGPPTQPEKPKRPRGACDLWLRDKNSDGRSAGEFMSVAMLSTG